MRTEIDISAVTVAFASGQLRLQGQVNLFKLLVAIIGYSIIANVNLPHVQYVMTFIMATGLYSSAPYILGRLSNNSAGHYKRVMTPAPQFAIANCGGCLYTITFSLSRTLLSSSTRSGIGRLGLTGVNYANK